MRRDLVERNPHERCAAKRVSENRQGSHDSIRVPRESHDEKRPENTDPRGENRERWEEESVDRYGGESERSHQVEKPADEWMYGVRDCEEREDVGCDYREEGEELETCLDRC